MTKGLISIVVPVYNASNFIEETIECVLDQTYEDWELLLVNDCSTDNSIEIIHRLMAANPNRQIRVIEQPTNLGAAKARNRGVQEANGNYLAFLDADDIWLPHKLEKTLSFLKEKRATFVCTSYEFADEMAVGNGKIAHVPERLTYKEALKNTIIFTTTVMFDLEKIEKEDLFMPCVKSEDTATWWRILKKGICAYGLDEVLVLYRRPRKSLSSNKLEAIRRIWNLYRKVEGLSLVYSAYNFIFYAYRTTMRRL